jgi:drug/metabolite transporter (DMT)-like permease
VVQSNLPPTSDTATPAAPETSGLKWLASPYFTTLLPPLFWTSNIIIGSIALESVPPVALSFWRWVIAFFILLPFGWSSLSQALPVVRQKWPYLLFLGFLSVGMYNTLMYAALEHTSAINLTVVGSFLPILIVVLSYFMLGDKLSPLQTLGVILSIKGVFIVVTKGELSMLLELSPQFGDLLMLGAAFCWALFSVLIRKYPIPLKPVVFLLTQIGFGFWIILPIYMWEIYTGHPTPFNLKTVGFFVYVAIFPAVLAFFSWNRGVAKLGPNTAGFYTNLVPILTAIAATLFLGEKFQMYHAVAIGFIFVGIFLATRRRKTPAATQKV